MMATEDIVQQYIKRLESILGAYQLSIQNQDDRLDERTAYGIITRSTEAIKAICVPSSAYISQLEYILGQGWSEPTKAELITGVLEALLEDLRGGYLYLASLSGLIHARIFDNFLDMAEYLLEEGYKDAAAVIGGSTLEAHLRELCGKYKIPLETTTTSKTSQHKTASPLNQDLGKAGAYSTYDQKQITAWLDIRNNAAHGKFSEYTEQQVSFLIAGIRDFIDRNPV